MRLFWRKGYAATSIEDLVDTLHLSRSSLYDTFGDKRKLFLEALRFYSQEVLGNLTQALTEADSPVTGIHSIFDQLTAGVDHVSGEMGCFMVNSIAELAPHDPEVTEIASAYATTFQKLLTEALTQGALQGLVTKRQTPEQLAAYIFNVIQGMRVVIKAGATLEQVQAVSAITLNSLQ
ncbi:MAG TPA: TetR/AcrR family transcriptional regulator [Phototrophicaceae bacterium]|nr:TetR/AcrR family transcriptional regulator [Phototrophicaceae bacterium]